MGDSIGVVSNSGTGYILNSEEESSILDGLVANKINLAGDGQYDTADTAVISNAFSEKLAQYEDTDKFDIKGDESEQFYADIVTDVISDMANQGFDVNESELNGVLSEALRLLV